MKYVIEIDEIQETEKIKDCATLVALHSALKKKYGKKHG